jgi:hypothetical protein
MVGRLNRRPPGGASAFFVPGEPHVIARCAVVHRAELTYRARPVPARWGSPPRRISTDPSCAAMPRAGAVPSPPGTGSSPVCRPASAQAARNARHERPWGSVCANPGAGSSTSSAASAVKTMRSSAPRCRASARAASRRRERSVRPGRRPAAAERHSPPLGRSQRRQWWRLGGYLR